MQDILWKIRKTDVNRIYTQTLIFSKFLQKFFGLGMWARFSDCFSHPSFSPSNSGSLPMPGSNKMFCWDCSSLSILKEASAGGPSSISHSAINFFLHTCTWRSLSSISCSDLNLSHEHQMEVLWKELTSRYKFLIISPYSKSFIIY